VERGGKKKEERTKDNWYLGEEGEEGNMPSASIRLR